MYQQIRRALISGYLLLTAQNRGMTQIIQNEPGDDRFKDPLNSAFGLLAQFISIK